MSVEEACSECWKRAELTPAVVVVVAAAEAEIAVFAAAVEAAVDLECRLLASLSLPGSTRWYRCTKQK